MRTVKRVAQHAQIVLDFATVVEPSKHEQIEIEKHTVNAALRLF